MPALRQSPSQAAGFQCPPEQLADGLHEWFTNGAADGFNVMPPALPGDLTTFAEQVLPILRRRGLIGDGYEGVTLREHYGLARPADRFDRPGLAAANS